ncbi:MAG: metallophosphoesterase, partial [Verrucomicrobia bacterium]|nr:metallophosphoesterase [Verrucomicrobiota bacterium]
RYDSIQHAALASALNSTGAASGFFQGVLDEARVWNYARTAAQISNNLNVEIASASGLVGRWGLNEGTGSNAADSSGNSVAGRLTNGPTWVSSANTPPQVALTAPPAGALFLAPGDLLLEAAAGDVDGTVTKVEFFAGATKLGEDVTAPHTFLWMNVPACAYSLTAVATDNSNAVTTSAAVSITVTNVATVRVQRGPYLQSATTSNLVVRWRTDVNTDGRVVFGTNLAQLTLTNRDSLSDTNHSVTLTGLLPATKYFYAVGHSGALLVGGDTNYFFVTPPPPGTPKPSRIWVIGDAGTATTNQTNVRDAYYAFAGTNRTDFWLQLGDNAYNSGTDAEYQAGVFNIYSNLLRNSVTWPCLGNHDTAQATTFTDAYPYFDIFTFPTNGEAGGVASGSAHYYAFDYANVHFVCLDSMTASRATNGPMATWLRLDLQANTNQWLIAFWHHPPYTKGSHDSDTETELVEMRTNFLPILESYGVDLVLSGHSHVYERSFLLNGHYGKTNSFDAATMVVNGGSGRETNGAGAYAKPRGHSQSNRGAVYVVAGSSGQTSSGSLDHPAMFVSLSVLASLVLDVNGNRLDVISLGATATSTNDSFTLLKTNTPPVASNAAFNVSAYGATNLALAAADLNRDALTFAAATLPTNGLLALNAGTGAFTYTPARGSTNADAFTFFVNDGATNSAPATVALLRVPLADTNANGLADAWEAQYGVTDPNADADGDGLTNLQEFWAGTNPNDANSWLRVASVAAAGGGFAVTWPSVGGVRYRVSFSNGDTGGNFNGVFTPLVRPLAQEMDAAPAGSASTQSFTDDYSLTGGAPVAGRRYYRVQLVR